MAAPETFGWWATNDPTGRSVREFRIAREAVERPVTGALWSPAQASEGAPLVLFGHGASGDRYQAPICHLAHRLADEAGCYSMAIDGPVHGMRQIGPGGRVAFGDEVKRADFMDDMVADWHCALAATRDQVTVGEIGYFGLSMGSIFGIPLLATLPETKSAVLGLLGTTKAGGPFAMRILADAAKITCPVLFLMQLEDELFPRDGYLAVFDALASTDKRVHANPGLHPEVPAEEIASSFDFLKRHLSAGGTALIIVNTDRPWSKSVGAMLVVARIDDGAAFGVGRNKPVPYGDRRSAVVPSRQRPGLWLENSHGTSPGTAGRWPASPGSRAWRRGCGPAARGPGEHQRRALFPARPRTEAPGWTLA